MGFAGAMAAFAAFLGFVQFVVGQALEVSIAKKVLVDVRVAGFANSTTDIIACGAQDPCE